MLSFFILFLIFIASVISFSVISFFSSFISFLCLRIYLLFFTVSAFVRLLIMLCLILATDQFLILLNVFIFGSLLDLVGESSSLNMIDWVSPSYDNFPLSWHLHSFILLALSPILVLKFSWFFSKRSCWSIFKPFNLFSYFFLFSLSKFSLLSWWKQMSSTLFFSLELSSSEFFSWFSWTWSKLWRCNCSLYGYIWA